MCTYLRRYSTPTWSLFVFGVCFFSVVCALSLLISCFRSFLLSYFLVCFASFLFVCWFVKVVQLLPYRLISILDLGKICFSPKVKSLQKNSDRVQAFLVSDCLAVNMFSGGSSDYSLHLCWHVDYRERIPDEGLHQTVDSFGLWFVGRKTINGDVSHDSEKCGAVEMLKSLCF